MTDAKPPEAAAKPEEKVVEPGVFGQFLQEHGIASTRVDNDAAGCESIELAAKDLQAALRLLRKSEETKLDLLLTITGIDSAKSYDSLYHLWSYDTLNELVIKVLIDKSGVKENGLPIVPSIARFWSAANWHERETYDLVGIRYVGHPYPRRILNCWDWEGYPLRRDYIQPVDALNDKAKGSFR